MSDNMNKTAKKILALATGCVVLTTGIFVGVRVYADNDGKEKELTSVKEIAENVLDRTVEKDEQTYSSYKDETVYVITASDGASEKVIVSDWLKDNVKGTEEYQNSESNNSTPVSLKITYSLDGKEVPASDLEGKSGHLKVSYSYENHEFTEKTINGKTEKIYVPFVAATGVLLNNEHFSNVTVEGGTIVNDGSKQVAVGISLPGISESLGMDEGSMPESFTLEADVTDYSPAIAYSFVTNLDYSRLGEGKINLDGIDLGGLLDGAVGVVTDALTQLSDGSSKLYDGLVTASDGCTQLSDGAVSAKDGAASLAAGAKSLSDGVNQLNSGASQLAAGAKSAYDGTTQLKTGAKSAADGAKQLNDGITQLNTGLETLTKNNAQLTGGAKQVFDTLLSTAYTSLIASGLTVPELTVDNYAAVISGAIASLEATDAEAAARAEVTGQVNASRPIVEEKVTAAVKAQVTEKVLATVGMTSETFAAAQQAGLVDEKTAAQLNGAIEMQMASEEVKALIKQNTDEQCAALVEQYMNSSEVKKQIKEGKEKVKSGIKSLKELQTSLDSYNTFYQGILAYTAGVASAGEGSKQLVTGSKSLKEGLDTLSDGTTTLSTGLKTLSDSTATLAAGTSTLATGATALSTGAGDLSTGLITLSDGLADLKDGLVQLKDGALTLSDGLSAFKTELTNKLESLDLGDVEGYIDRLNAILEVSSEYRSFTGLADDQDGKVKYIYKIG